MNESQQQFLATQRALLDLNQRLQGRLLDGAARLVALNVQATRSMLADSNRRLQAMLQSLSGVAKGGVAGAVAAPGVAKAAAADDAAAKAPVPAAEQMAAYLRGVQEIGAELQGEMIALLGERQGLVRDSVLRSIEAWAARSAGAGGAAPQRLPAGSGHAAGTADAAAKVAHTPASGARPA